MEPTFKRAPRVLGTKHHVTDEQWNNVARNIENHVTRTELDNLADYTIEKIKKTAHGKRVAYGWSGGKDSIDHRAEWNEIYTIDPSLVERAAYENIPGARRYLYTR